MQINIEQVCHEWEARGFSCDIWSDPPGQIWANFVHATDELVMLLEGEIELEYSSRCVRPEVGMVVLIPAGVSHTVRNIGDCQNRWLYGYRKYQD
jgi:uncharacterized cupin superfamily protein